MTDAREIEIPGPGRLRVLGFPDNLVRAWTAELPVRWQTYENVTAVPIGTGRGGRYVGGLLDSEGMIIRDSERAKSNKAWRFKRPKPELDLSGAERLPGRTLFIGYHMRIFGHTLLELLPRLWPDEAREPYDTLLCYPSYLERAKPRVALPRYVRTLLGGLGIDHRSARIVAQDRPLRVNQLSIASPGFWLKRGYHPQVVRPFEQIADEFERQAGPDGGDRPRKIYLSRSHLGPGQRKATNEPEIEAIMARRGYTVVHPQELPMQDQVVLVRRAEAIAGCDGSALHLGAFARPGTRLLALDSRVVHNQFVIDEFRGLDALHAMVSTELLDDRADQWVADLDRVRHALDVPR